MAVLQYLAESVVALPLFKVVGIYLYLVVLCFALECVAYIVRLCFLYFVLDLSFSLVRCL